MTISYAIGKNSTEGRTHTMCIEGTQGTEGRGWRDQGHSRPEGTLDELGQPGHMTGLQWTRPRSGLTLTLTPAISELASLPSGCENPKPSLTELVVLEHGLYAGDPVSKVLLQPLTGVSRMCAQGPCSLLTMSCLGLSRHRAPQCPHPAGEEPAREPPAC